MQRKGSGSFYLSFLQYWSDFPHIHPAYFGQICTSLSSLLPLHWKLYIQQFRILDVFHLFEWFPYLEQPQKKASQVLVDLTVQVRVGARMRWTVLVLGIFLIMEQTPIFGLRVSEPDYLVWLRPLIASSKGSVALQDYQTDSSANGIWDVSNWGHFHCVLLHRDVLLVGAAADKER